MPTTQVDVERRKTKSKVVFHFHSDSAIDRFMQLLSKVPELEAVADAIYLADERSADNPERDGVKKGVAKVKKGCK